MPTCVHKSFRALPVLLVMALAGAAATMPERDASGQESSGRNTELPGLTSALLATSADGRSYTEQKVTAPEGTTRESFGFSVAIDGDTALVGVPFDDIDGNHEQGSVYIFTRTGTTWSLQQKVTAVDGEAGDWFGRSVAVDGDTALIGAPYDGIGLNANQGSVYVFTRSGTTWSQQVKGFAADGAADDLFAYAVALDGNTALVGAPGDKIGDNVAQGSAYVFTRSGSTWSQQVKGIAFDGAAYDNFGASVALDGDTALVGAPYDDIDGRADQGSAYVFTRSGTTWTLQVKGMAADGAAYDNFGASVALDGDTALVGAPYDDIGGRADQGSAYVFTRSGTTWTLQVKGIAADGEAFDLFGSSLAVDGDTALVGAPYDDIGVAENQGSVYLYTRRGTTWTLQVKGLAGDGEEYDHFGIAVAVDGDTFLVGAPYDEVDGIVDQGSAYFYEAQFDLYLPLVTANG